jgi:hypothetical protein
LPLPARPARAYGRRRVRSDQAAGRARTYVADATQQLVRSGYMDDGAASDRCGRVRVQREDGDGRGGARRPMGCVSWPASNQQRLRLASSPLQFGRWPAGRCRLPPPLHGAWYGRHSDGLTQKPAGWANGVAPRRCTEIALQ